MTDQPLPPKKKRTIKRRPRRIPNAAPGHAGIVPDEPRAIAPGIHLDGDSVAVAAYVPPAPVILGSLGPNADLAEDLTGLTPRQRRWWKGAAARNRRIDDAARARYLASLAQWPDFAMAAANGGFSPRSFELLRARDPEFNAAALAAAKSSIPRVEHAARLRAFEGTLDPIVQNGQVVAYRRVFSDRLAELTLRRLDPEGYSEKLMVAGQVNGTVRHVHELAPSTAELVRSIATVGAPIEGTAEKVEPRQITAAGVVAEMLGRSGTTTPGEEPAEKPLDVVPADEVSVGSQRKAR